MSIARPGEAQALANAHADTMPAVHRWLSGRTVGTTFTAAQMGEELPGWVIDKPARLAAIIAALARTGHITFAGYGPSRSHDDWGRPSRIWEVTDKGREVAA